MSNSILLQPPEHHRRRSSGKRLATGAVLGLTVGTLLGAGIAVSAMTQGLQCHVAPAHSPCGQESSIRTTRIVQ